MAKMSNTTAESDSEEDTLTSSEYSESSDNESSEQDKDDTSDTASCRSLSFRVRKNRSTVTVKSKRSNKRVRFKPGDSLVLIYIIPNREMLGLKSDSEESDYCESDEDSDDEEDDNEDEDDEESDDAADDDSDDEDDDECNGKKNKNKSTKPKPFAKLLAVKQINRRKPLPDLRSNLKKPQEKPKLLNLELNPCQTNFKKKQRLKTNKKDKKEKTKPPKKDFNESKAKQSKNKKSKFNAIKTDLDKPARNKRNRTRLLEIRATVESSPKHQETNVPASKGITKPSVIDVCSSAQINSSKVLTNRTRLQPTSFRVTKPGENSGIANNMTERPVSVAKVVSASYESLTSVLPSSYVTLNSFQNGTVEETIKRLDPDSMNASGKRNYAWQIANGTISSQTLRTPSILPFWDSLQNSVTENNTLKLPT